jgi:hypothetical protein
MAARKNKVPKTTSAEARAFVVVLEEIRAQNKVFGEGQQLLREEQQMLRQDHQSLRQDMSVRFDRVEHDIAEIRNDVGLVKIAVLDHARELKEIRMALDKKVDREGVEAIVHRVVARSG